MNLPEVPSMRQPLSERRAKGCIASFANKSFQGFDTRSRVQHAQADRVDTVKGGHGVSMNHGASRMKV